MANRTDNLQLRISIDGAQAGKTYKDIQREARSLAAQLDKLAPGTEAFNKKAAELKSVNTRLAEIRTQTRGVAAAMDEARAKSSAFGGVFSKAFALGTGFIAAQAGITSFFGLLKESFTKYADGAKIVAQQNAVLTSTNQAAGRTFEDLKKQAKEWSSQTLFSGGQIQEAQNFLLTFTKVRGEIYDNALPAVLDYATAFKIDLKTASVQVGKALNDPLKGLVSLSRAGVQFTESQKAMIKSMVESGDLAAAQGIILKELSVQFGNSAKAAADAGLGPYEMFKKQLGAIKKSLGEVLFKGFDLIRPALVIFVKGFERAIAVLITIVNTLAAVPKFVKENRAAFIALGVAIVAFNAQAIIASANAIRLAAVQKAQAIATTALTIAQRLLNTAMKANPIGAIIAAISLLVSGIILAYNKSEKFRAVIQGLKQVGLEFFQIFKEAFRSFGEGFDLIKEGKIGAGMKKIGSGLVKLNPVSLAFTEGKRLGAAFNKGFDDSLAKSKADKDAAAFNKKVKNAGKTPVVVDDINAPSGDKDKDKEDPIKKGLDELDKALKRQQNLTEKSYQQNLISQQEYEAKKRQNQKDSLNAQLDFLKANGQAESDLFLEKEVEILRINKEMAAEKQKQALTDLEAENKAELDALEAQYLRKEFSEKEFNSKKLQLRLEQIQDEMILLETFGQQETEKYRALRLEQLKINNEIDAQAFTDRMNIIKDQMQSELNVEEMRFLNKLISEEEFQIKKLQIQSEGLQKELDALEEAGLKGTKIYQETELELTRIKEEGTKKRKRTILSEEESIEQIKEQTIEMLQKTFEVGIDLLGKDEDARRKNMEAIKAMQIASVMINSGVEISGIWARAQENGMNAIIPGWGTIYATIMTGISLARTYSNIQKINAQKYWGGGYTGDGAKHDPAGVVHKGEIVWSQEDIARHGGVMAVEKMRLSRGYMSGGFVTDRDTRPVGMANVPINGASVAPDSNLVAYVQELIREVRRIPDNIRAYIVYEDLKAKDREMASILSKASI